MRLVGRELSKAVGRNRWWSGFKAGSKSFFGSLGPILHTLFLEVTGVLFLFLTAMFVMGFVREYNKYATGQGSVFRLVVVGFFGLLLVWYGLTSFWRARRRRSR